MEGLYTWKMVCPEATERQARTGARVSFMVKAKMFKNKTLKNIDVEG